MTDPIVTDEDWALLSRIPEQDVVEMAIDLDILVPEVVDRRAIIDRCVWAIVERAAEEGLPFSKYDHEDLAALPGDELQAIGRLAGVRGNVTVGAVLKAGQKVYRMYEKQRPNNPTALLIPSLLRVLARAAMRR